MIMRQPIANSPVKEKKVVLDTLAKATKSNPGKSYAQAMIDGTITEDDLSAINSTTTFPNNNYNRLKLAEGEYSSMQAMEDFIAKIGPYLSDAVLYKITHLLAAIETDGNTNTQAFRNSTLAKYFMKYEVARHKKQAENNFPAVFLSHMHEYVLPLCNKYWGGNIETNIIRFAEFNLGANTLGVYDAIANFAGVDIDALDNNSPAGAVSTTDFLQSLKAVKTPAVDEDAAATTTATSSSSAKSKSGSVISKPQIVRDVKKRATEFALLFSPALDRFIVKLQRELDNLMDKSMSHHELFIRNLKENEILIKEKDELNNTATNSTDVSMQIRLTEIDNRITRNTRVNQDIEKAEQIVTENIDRVRQLMANVEMKISREKVIEPKRGYVLTK